MKNRTKILAATIACVGITSAALAHNHGGGKGPRAERMIERMDADGSGTVTRDEARAFAATRFARLDANSDGEVTKDERRAARAMRRGERVARMDADNDGLISQAEMTAAASARATRRFARIDADGDGFATVDEIAKMRGEGRRMRGEWAGGKRGPVTQAMMEERILKRFARIDTDNDGIITVEDVRRR